jgi:hypothetical protein
MCTHLPYLRVVDETLNYYMLCEMQAQLARCVQGLHIDQRSAVFASCGARSAESQLQLPF